MVNLPPDSPDPGDRRPVSGAPPQTTRLLTFDELLAVILAFLGIGSILWWGLSRSPNLVTSAGLLERRSTDSEAIAPLEGEEPAPPFEPRTLEREQRPRPDPVDSPAGLPGSEIESQVRRKTDSAPVVVVPTAPNTVPSSPPTPAAQTTQPLDISDVPPTHWAYPFIKPMFDEGYLPDFPEQGFQPDQILTRAELAALLSQAFGNVPREGSARSFSDVPSNYWAASAIDNAVAQGFMNGYPEGDFRPDQAVPRYEVLVSLVTGLGLAPSPNPDSTLQAFVDRDGLPDWAGPKVAAAVDEGLVVNYPARDRLKPAQAATRAEIVAMIHQALVAQGKLPAVASEYTVP